MSRVLASIAVALSLARPIDLARAAETPLPSEVELRRGYFEWWVGDSLDAIERFETAARSSEQSSVDAAAAAWLEAATALLRTEPRLSAESHASPGMAPTEIPMDALRRWIAAGGAALDSLDDAGASHSFGVAADSLDAARRRYERLLRAEDPEALWSAWRDAGFGGVASLRNLEPYREAVASWMKSESDPTSLDAPLPRVEKDASTVECGAWPLWPPADPEALARAAFAEQACAAAEARLDSLDRARMLTVEAIERRRAYLLHGIEEAERVATEIERWSTVLDSLANLVGPLGDDLLAALREVAASARARAEHWQTISDSRHAIVTGLETFRSGGPARTRPRAAAIAAAADSMLATERAALASLDLLCRVLSDGRLDEWCDEFQQKDRPAVEARLARLRALASSERDRALALSRRLEAERRALDSSSPLAELDRRREEAVGFRDARRAALRLARREAEARAAERAIAALEPAVEAVDYGLACADYQRAVRDADGLGTDRELALANLSAFLVRWPKAQSRNDVRYRWADLQMQAARQHLRAGDLDSGDAANHEAVRALLSILDDEAPFPHRDAVLRELGLLGTESGDLASRRYLERLLAEYPDTRYAQEASLRLGEIAFDAKDWTQAVPHLQAAAEGSDPGMRAAALYKLGWSAYAIDRLDLAEEAFVRLLDSYEEGLASATRANLRDEAKDCLVRTLIRAGGAEAFARRFNPVGQRAYEARVLDDLATLLREHAAYRESAAAESLWIARYPLAPDALEHADRWLSDLASGNRSEEVIAVAASLAPAFLADGAWGRAQESDSLRRAGEQFARDAFQDAAYAHHARARVAADPSQYAAADRFYSVLLERWPADPAAMRWRYQAAEVAAQRGDLAGAASLYHEVARSDSSTLAPSARWAEIEVLDAWYARNAHTDADGIARGEPEIAKRWLGVVDDYWTWRRDRSHSAPDDTSATGGQRDADLLWREAEIAFAHEEPERAANAWARLAREHAADARADLALERRVALFEARKDRREAALACEERALRHADASRAEWRYRASSHFGDAGATDDALRVLDQIVRQDSTSALRTDAWLRGAELLEANGQPSSAAERLARFAATPAPTGESEAAARQGALRRAITLAEGDGRRDRGATWRRDYARRFSEDRDGALELLEPLVERELDDVATGRRLDELIGSEQSATNGYLALAGERGGSPKLSARLEYLRAEEARPAYEAIALRLPLAASVAARNRALEALLARYRACLDQGDPEWTRAASYRIGGALVAFGDALEASERPAELSAEDRAGYDEVIAEQAWGFFDRGEEVWRSLLADARDDSVDLGGWVERTQRALWPRLAKRYVHRPEGAFPRLETIDARARAARLEWDETHESGADSTATVWAPPADLAERANDPVLCSPWGARARQALSRTPSSAAALLGDLYASDDSTAAAGRWYDLSLELDPENAPARLAAAAVRHASGDWESARALLTPLSSADRSKDLRLLAVAALALVDEASGESERALRETDIVARDAEEIDDRELRAMALSAAVAVRLRSDDFDRALPWAENAAKLREGAIERNNLAIARLHQGRPADAREELLQARELDPRLPGPLYNLAIVESAYFLDLEAAQDWFEQYSRLATDDPDGLKQSLSVAREERAEVR